jgi:hypothetical protein
MASVPLTEQKRINFADCCGCFPKFPVYLMWWNKLGGTGYWLFEYNQELADEISEGESFSPWREDLETAQSFTELLSKRVVPKLTVGANNVSKAKYGAGLRGLRHAVRIQMMLNPPTEDEVTAWDNGNGTDMPWQTDGIKWLTVKIAPGTFKLWDTSATHFNIEFALTLQELQVQAQ